MKTVLPTPPVAASAAAAAERAYGWTSVLRASGPPADTSRHCSASESPAHGMPATHAGGAPIPRARKSVITAGLRSAASSSVVIAMANGAMKASRTRRVMIAAASGRRPPVARCRRNSSGQVAIAMVVAQISPLRNGSNVHALPSSSAPTKSTNSMMRVMSVEASDCMAPPLCLSSGGHRIW